MAITAFRVGLPSMTHLCTVTVTSCKDCLNPSSPSMVWVRSPTCATSTALRGGLPCMHYLYAVMVVMAKIVLTGPSMVWVRTPSRVASTALRVGVPCWQPKPACGWPPRSHQGSRRPPGAFAKLIKSMPNLPAVDLANGLRRWAQIAFRQQRSRFQPVRLARFKAD